MSRSTMDDGPMRSRGLGILSVSGRSRWPRPPAMMTPTGVGITASNSATVRTATKRPPSTTGMARTR